MALSPDEWGLALYLGVPQMGKTYLAVYHAQESRAPVFVVDGGGVCRWPAELSSMAVAFDRIYTKRESARWMPRSDRELEASMEGIEAAQRRFKNKGLEPPLLEILLDEAADWMTANYCPPVLRHLVRIQAHLNLKFRFTTQCPQDVFKRHRNIASEVYAFRNDDDAALEALEQWRFDPELVRVLPPRKFYEWRRAV